MALAVHHRRGRSLRASSPGTAAVTAPRIYERPVGAAFTGLLALLVGAWGALAGYIGPYFYFRPVAHDTWVTNLANGLLHLLPGAVAAGAGLMLLAMGPARRSIRGGAFLLPALLLLAAGAWFVIGPLAWPTFEHGNTFATGVSPLRNLLNVAASSYAPGLILVMLGGMAFKAGTVPPVAVGDPYMPAEAGTGAAGAGMAAAPGMAGTGATTGTTTGRAATVAEEERMAHAQRTGANQTAAMPAQQEGAVPGTEPMTNQGQMANEGQMANQGQMANEGRMAGTTPPAAVDPVAANRGPVDEEGNTAPA